MLLALKIDVDTLRGTREGVPTLIDWLRRHEAGATFLVSNGAGPEYDLTGLERLVAFRDSVNS